MLSFPIMPSTVQPLHSGSALSRQSARAEFAPLGISMWSRSSSIS